MIQLDQKSEANKVKNKVSDRLLYLNAALKNN